MKENTIHNKQQFIKLVYEGLRQIKGRITGNHEHLNCGQTMNHCLFNFQEYLNDLNTWYKSAKVNFTEEQQEALISFEMKKKIQILNELVDSMYEEQSKSYGGLDDFISAWKKYEKASQIRYEIKYQNELVGNLEWITNAYEDALKKGNQLKTELDDLHTFFDKKLKTSEDAAYQKVKKEFDYYVEEPLEVMEDAQKDFRQNYDSILKLQGDFSNH